MFSVLVCFVASVAYSEGGVFRNNLAFEGSQNFGFGLPITTAINSQLLNAPFLPREDYYSGQDVPETPERYVSYSLSHDDYLYLKRHKVNGQDSPYNPDPIEQAQTQDEVTETHDQVHGERSGCHHKLEKHNVPCTDISKRSAETNSINGKFPHNSVSAEQVVHKHVYFHVPPPDFEEPPSPLPVGLPSKKNVNILFIKAPSYDTHHQYLQQLYQQQLQASLGDKTLIYVLSKNEPSPQPVVFVSKPSVPEVFFINYKDSPGVSSENSELDLSGLL